jgi:hypothetical protein
MEAVAAKRPPVKVRDVLKYALAAVLALTTFVAIAGMEYVKYQRRSRSAAEQERIQNVMRQYGTEGRIPDKLTPPPSS